MKKLSIIVPCYNEEEVIDIFYEELSGVINNIKDMIFEILFIDDGSRDQTLNKIKKLALHDKRVFYVSFSRNFGKESGIYAGLRNCSGDYAVIMDADLQDPPHLIPVMLKALTEDGFDCVGSKRTTRNGEPPVRSFFARMFYKLMNRFSDTSIVDGARDFQMMTRKVVDSILDIREYNRFSKGIFEWVGFKKKWLEYENIERCAGNTKWSFFKLFKYAVDGIVAFTIAPLQWIIGIGIFICLIAVILWIVFLFVNTTNSIYLPILLVFLSGIQISCLGVIGQYFSKIYLEVKNRPIYIVGESNIFEQPRLKNGMENTQYANY